jgi:hypothetical protein
MAYQNQNTQALTVTAAQTALDEATIDPRLIMAAKAIQLMAGQDNDGKPKISADMALAAAMYQAGTGQLLGRDFYVNEKIGRMEGYRGVSRDAMDRGVGEVQIKYRSLTAQECEDHEIAAGDTAVVCEVYQLRTWNLAQRMGQPYEPISGVGVIRKIEKFTAHEWKESSSGKKYKSALPENQWKPLTLEGGMTWRKKAQNRAYKEAMRHVPGAHASAAEVLEEATIHGMTEQPPEAAHLTMEQAIAWAKQNAPDSGPDWGDAEDAEFTHEEAKPEPPAAPQNNKPAPTGNGAKPATRPDWHNVDDAVMWGMDQGAFKALQHSQNAYNKLKAEAMASDNPPKNAKDMFDRWHADVLLRLEKAKAATITDAELDGTETDEAPQF